MNKLTIFPLYFLCVLMVTLNIYSCKNEYITEEPEVVYDRGDRLTLNDHLIIMKNSSMTHNNGQKGILFDETTGQIQFDQACELGVAFEMDTNTVLNIEMEDNVHVRKVTKVSTAGNQYILETEEGNINHIFDHANIKFDFSPEFSNEQLLTKSASLLSGQELSQALTDDEGRIHPTRIRLVDGDKEVTIFSVKDNIPLTKIKSANNHDGKVGFEHQFNPQLYVPKLPVTVGIEDFGFSLWTKLKADYNISKHYYTKTVLGHSVKVYDGETGTFTVTAEDTDISGWVDLGIEARDKASLVDEDIPLFDPKEVMFDIQVGVVPVIIGVEIELILELDFDLEGEIKMITGLEFDYNIPKVSFGAWKNASISDQSSGITHDVNLIGDFAVKPRPFRVEALAKLTQNYSIRPSLGFSIYRSAGPEVSFPFHAIYTVGMGVGESIDLADTTATPQVYLGWGANLSAKAGAKCGMWLDFLGFADKHIDIPEIPVTPEIPLWHTPGSLNPINKNGFDKTFIGESREVEVQVTDFITLPTPMMFVMWENDGGGTWKYPITVTGVNGKTKNTYTPTLAGEYEPYCVVKNGSLVEAGKVKFKTKTTAK